MEKSNLICCPNDLRGLTKTFKIFTAGPIQGSSDWQHNLPDIPGVTWISPRRLDYNSFDYDQQTKWETIGLRIANLVLFWIPEPVENIPGRSYAQTTRIEFGEILGRYDKPCVFGCYPDYPGRQYLEYKVKEYTNQPLHSTLEECINEIKERLPQTSHTFFTSDTHFGSQRALELSKRPFRTVKEMDWSIISRWNSVVSPFDTVYHLGDFGNTWPASYLTGNIRFILGNYERDNKTKIPQVEVLGDTYILDDKYILSHEPLLWKDYNTTLSHLFGHIHGRQKVKEWGGLDVGVDCNNFTPISEEDVDFYLNAIRKGYYDKEVWS